MYQNHFYWFNNISFKYYDMLKYQVLKYSNKQKICISWRYNDVYIASSIDKVNLGNGL